MRRNIVAILLSISLVAGSFGTAPLYATEVTAQEAIMENEQGGASVPSEDDPSEPEKEEGGADTSSQNAAEESVENEYAGGKDDQTEASVNGSFDESDMDEIAEEGLSGEEAVAEEAGSDVTNVDAELAAVVEPTLESTESKEAALAGETGDVVASGSCGENATWTLTGTENDLTLTISGSGEMKDYSQSYVDLNWVSNAPWIYKKDLITRVIIEEGITTIGSRSFDNCSNIQSISIPGSVTSINGFALSGCSSLQNLSLPGSLNYIGAYAFTNCEGLESIIIPDSVTIFGDYALSYCDLNELRIPKSAIQASSFLYGTFVERLVIYGEGEIENTLYNCLGSSSVRNSLVDLVFEGNFTYIGSIFGQGNTYGMFTCLQTITLPVSITSFYGDENHYIENNNITVIGYGNTFAEIWAQEKGYTFEPIEVLEIAGSLDNGINWMLDSGKTLTISGDGEINQAPWSSLNSVIKKVVIQEGVTEIGDCNCFSGGKMIEEVVLPDSLTRIGKGAFYNCAIESISIPNRVTEIGQSAFYSTHLTTVNIPENVSKIGAYAFQYCNNLEEIRIPNEALANSDSMISYATDTLYLSSLKTICIYGKGNIPSFRTYSNYTESPFYPSRGSIENIIIEEGITGISTNAFSGCVNVSYVRLPSTMLDKDSYSRRASFAGCPNLKTAGPLGSGCNIEYGWTERIPSYAFEYMSYLESITFPEGLKEIGEMALWGCDSLQEVIIPDTVEKIEPGAFRYCGLTHVYLPSSVKTMGPYVFADCSNLTSAGPADSGCDIEYGWTGKIPDNAFLQCNFDTVEIADTIKIIGKSSFSISDINSFIIPESVNTINEYAFQSSKIAKIIFKGNIPSINDRAFSSAICNAYYPYGNETYTSSTMVGYGGTITWKANPETTGTLTKLELIKEPAKKLYVTGEELSLEGLRIKAYYDSGYDEIIDSTEITVGEHDLSTPGNKQIEIWYKDKSISFDVNVCTLVDKSVDSSLYPESTHDYENNLNEEYSFIYEDAQRLSVTFSAATQVEDDIDFIYIYDSNGTLLNTYTGTSAAGQTIDINGNSFVIKLVSDDSGTAYGFSIDSITALAYGHVWHETVFKEPTCTEEGLKGLECQECGYRRSEITPALGHTYEDTVVEPACTTDGYTSHVCTRCGDSYIDNEIDAPGHTFSEWVVDQDSTCTEDGTKHRECSVCEYIETEIIDKNEHAFSSDYIVDVEPTCTESGEKSIYCENCGEKKEDSTVEIPALEHLYGEAVIEPTCTTGGYTIHICGRCSDSYKDYETEPKGHTFTDWIIDHDSTCTEEGIQHRECADCGYIETRGINKKEHSFDTEFTVDKEPTCTTDGSRSYHCTSEGCTATTGSEVIPATGHDYSDWTVTREATCTESGEMQRTCAVCDETEAVEYGARGHVWLKTYTVDREATCTEEGSESIRCAACDEVKEGSERVISATGHTMAHVEAVPATYEHEGNTEYYKCDTCGRFFEDENGEQEIQEEDTVIPALEWIPVASVSLDREEITLNPGLEAVLMASVLPDDASDKTVTWSSSDENVATIGNDGTVTAVNIGDAVITADADDGKVSAQCIAHVVKGVKIVSGPSDVTAFEGERVKLCVEAEGEGLSYQWQWGADGTAWKNCTSGGCNTETFSFVMKASVSGRRYRCMVSKGSEIEFSDSALITLDAIRLTKDPEDVTAAAGDKVELSVEAEGEGLSYQWQWSADGAVWKNCTSGGHDKDTFSFTMKGTLAGRRYRCIVSKSTQKVESAAALITLDAIRITKDPEDVEAHEGELVVFSVEAEGTGLSYQWQWSSNGTTWKNCTSGSYNTGTFSFAMKSTVSGRRYRCIVKGGGQTLTSNPGTVTLVRSAEIIRQPSDVEAAVGETVEFSVEVRGEDPAYQWQWSSDGTTWRNCTSGSFNKDTFSFKMKASVSGRQYRCIVTCGAETLTSDAGVVTLK